MKTIECDRCHRLFRSTDERIFIHTKTQDFNWCTECTRRALELMDTRLDEESKIRLNHECMSCPLKKGCLTTCATQPEDVINPPCGKYAIGIVGNRNDSFWTRPAEAWMNNRFNTNPEDLRYVIVNWDNGTKVSIL